MKQSKSHPERAEVIGFRLDADALRALSARAAGLGLSRHELARQFVIEMLQQAEERANLLNALAAIHKQISELRGDVSLSTQTLLVSAGKADPKEAEAWASENFGEL